MNKKKYFNKLERLHHDEAAEMYSFRRKSDYIWEVPESIFLLKKIFFTKGKTVIDMGCGPAISIKKILSNKILNNIKYIGVDISANMLKYAKKSVPHGDFIRGDFESVKIPNNYADVILSLGALHHSISVRRTLLKWTSIIKKDGLLMIREPVYEVLKRGEGESPIEEGVKVNELLNFLQEKNFKVLKLIFFSSNFFHLINRILIKLKLGSWQNIKFLWYLSTIVDSSIIKYFSKLNKIFRGQAFILIARKS